MSDTEVTTREPNPEKVAKVAEIKRRLDESQAVFISAYRGLTVSQLAELRNALRPNDADYVVLKNNLVKRAVADAGIVGLDDHLVGPNAITFVRGDVAGAAKALRDADKQFDVLEIKGGVLGDAVLTDADIRALADLPSRDELLARLAGGLQAPLTKTARLLQAVPNKFAYGLAALIEQQESAA